MQDRIMTETYTNSLRSLRSALCNYISLLGEPSPLLGNVASLLVDIIGSLPPGDISKSEQFYKITSIILEAAILGIINRLEGLQPKSGACLQSIDDCMKIAKSLSVYDRCNVFFKILGKAIDDLHKITGQEYPQLYDGSGKKLCGEL
jgi:hypothetical protein